MQTSTLCRPLASYWRHFCDGYDVSEIFMNPGIRHFRVKNSEMECTLKKVEERDIKIHKPASNVEDIGTTLRSQQQKIQDVEDRNRQNNLIAFGIFETYHETSDQIRRKGLIGVFEEELGVNVDTVERIQRLGRKHGNKVLPVIMRFFSYK